MGRCVNFLLVVVYKFILNRIHTYTYMCVLVYCVRKINCPVMLGYI